MGVRGSRSSGVPSGRHSTERYRPSPSGDSKLRPMRPRPPSAAGRSPPCRWARPGPPGSCTRCWWSPPCHSGKSLAAPSVLPPFVFSHGNMDFPGRKESDCPKRGNIMCSPLLPESESRGLPDPITQTIRFPPGGYRRPPAHAGGTDTPGHQSTWPRRGIF